MKIGIITFTDDRKRVAKSLETVCFGSQRDIARWLKCNGHNVVEARREIRDRAAARAEAKRTNRASCDVVVFNITVWPAPDWVIRASLLVDGRVMWLSEFNPLQVRRAARVPSIARARHFVRILRDLLWEVVQLFGPTLVMVWLVLRILALIAEGR